MTHRSADVSTSDGPPPPGPGLGAVLRRWFTTPPPSREFVERQRAVLPAEDAARAGAGRALSLDQALDLARIPVAAAP